ncbi:MAG: DICT sensory domain-containing protein [Phototrophicaceae bacterium]
MTLLKNVSLFEMSKAVVGHSVPIMHCSKVTLVHLSHTLEDIVLKNNLPALMFTGFQESSHWMKETERYAALADVAQQICIFAGKPLPDNSAAKAIQVTLAANDPLRQEWFVIILSEDFNVLLTGQDNLISDERIPDKWRTFETILSFDPAIITNVLDQLEKVLASYRPDLIASLQTTRTAIAPIRTNPIYFSEIVSEFVNFEEKLNRKIRYESDLNTQVIDTMKAFTLILDRNSTIISVNAALQKAFQRPLDEILGQNFLSLCLPEENHLMARQVIKNVLSMGVERRLITMIDINNKIRHIDWDISIIYLSDHSESLFVMGHDVTERVALEKLSVEEAKVRAVLENERKLSQLRAQFITTISHEFRSPLSSILNSTEMLDKRYDYLGEDGRKQRLKRMKNQVLILNGMVEEIIIAMNASDGYLSFRPIECAITDSVIDIIDNIILKANAEERIAFVSHIEDQHIIADPHLIRFILSNLVTNALKYSPIDTMVSITLTRKKYRLFLSVADKGSGIPIEDQPYIFEPFFRGKNVEKVQGSGIGLQIVHDCVMIYGGTIDFKSDANGTIFNVQLPIPTNLPES